MLHQLSNAGKCTTGAVARQAGRGSASRRRKPLIKRANLSLPPPQGMRARGARARRRRRTGVHAEYIFYTYQMVIPPAACLRNRATYSPRNVELGRGAIATVSLYGEHGERSYCRRVVLTVATTRGYIKCKRHAFLPFAQSSSPLTLAAVHEGPPGAISSPPRICSRICVSLGDGEVGNRCRAVVFIKLQARFEIRVK